MRRMIAESSARSSPVARRAALLDWARATGGLVVEDDYDGEFRYDVSPLPALRSLPGAGDHVVYVGTAPETVAQAERSVREELDRLLRDGIEDTEMEDARSYLLGRDPFRRETARQWADLLAETELYGIPVDQPDWVRTTLEALKKEDIESAARQWIRPDELRVTLGLPA